VRSLPSRTFTRLTSPSARSYFQNTGRLNRSGDAYRTIKCVLP
jgi:hypothetical protein